MTETELWAWVTKQGSTFVAFIVGCWGGHFFTKTVFQNRTELEKERYNHVLTLLDQLRQDQKESERMCAERLTQLEKKYSDDLLVIKELAESNERKALAMISNLSQLARHNFFLDHDGDS